MTRDRSDDSIHEAISTAAPRGAETANLDSTTSRDDAEHSAVSDAPQFD
jgi:hypothetical protein